MTHEVFSELMKHDREPQEARQFERGAFRSRGRGGFRAAVETHEESKGEEDDGF